MASLLWLIAACMDLVGVGKGGAEGRAEEGCHHRFSSNDRMFFFSFSLYPLFTALSLLKV